jgi:iron complex outermembrane receptor protein
LQIDGRYLETIGYGPSIGAPTLQEDYRLTTKSWSEFGQAEYDIVKNLTLTVGGRWSTDQKRLNLRINQLTCDTPACPVDTTVPPFIIDTTTAGENAKNQKSDWSGKIALDWHATEQIMPYVSWSKGIKSGGFNAPDAIYNTYSFYKFGEERLYATELGIKTQTFDDRVRINVDAFYYDYQGYQATNTVNVNTYITNQPAKIRGGELEGTFLPIRQLHIHQGLAFLNAVIEGIALPDGTIASRQAVQAPHVSYTGGIDYDWNIAEGGHVTLGGDYNYRSAQYFQLTNDPAAKETGFWLANLHSEYTTANAHWSFKGYANNVFAKEYLTNIFAVGSVNLGQGVYGQRRELGLRVTYHL